MQDMKYLRAFAIRHPSLLLAIPSIGRWVFFNHIGAFQQSDILRSLLCIACAGGDHGTLRFWKVHKRLRPNLRPTYTADPNDLYYFVKLGIMLALFFIGALFSPHPL
jgi:hypothetical protein